MIYIYLLENLEQHPNKIYIGKTKNINYRKNSHKHNYGDNIHFTIIDQIQSHNKTDWKPLESYWIEQFKQWGFELINQNSGGGGLDYVSDEVKLKMSKSKRNYNVTWGDKISKTKKGIKIGPFKEEHKINLRASRIKNQGTPVKQIDIITGDIINSFDSISLATDWIIENTNTKSKLITIKNGIKDCSVGRQNTSCGFRWVY
jgi:hypothetical protein